jgi:putative DNA primase/helicase
MPKTLLEIALTYHRQGWSVIPLKYRDKDKKPLISWKHFEKNRPSVEDLNIWFGEKFTGTLKYDQLKLWFAAWKTAPTEAKYREIFSTPRNIGIVTGDLSNVAAIDCDSPEAVQLYASLGGDINGPYFNTQRGQQFVTKCRPGVGNFQGNSNLKDIDLRANGGYCTAPNSVHWGGAKYVWHNIDPNVGLFLPEFPDEVLAAAYPKKRSQTGYTASNPAEPEPSFQEKYENPKGRNMTLAQMCGSWAKDHCDLEFMLRQAKVWNFSIPEPLEDKELETVVHSIYKKETENKKREVLPLDHRISTFFACTDAGNGERFVARYGKDVRCIDGNSWLFWCGTHWKEAKLGEVEQMCLSTIRAIETEGGLQINSKDYNDLLNFAKRSEGLRSTQAALKYASTMPPIPTLHSEFNKNRDIFVARNGTLEIAQGKLREHRREDMSSQIADVDYDENATCPGFMEFLDQIFAKNQSLIYYLQEVIGYCLTGHTTEQKMWILHGDGANGKSTLCSIISKIFGGYGFPSPRNLFMAKVSDGHPVDLATLVGKRFVVAEESEESQRLSESLVKQLTGSSLVATRELYKNFFSFLPTYKIFFQTNHKPEIREGGRGIWRRLKPIPFNVEIAEPQQDRTLDTVLYETEGSGILNWALRGAMRWYERGSFIEAEAVQKSASEYQEEMDYLFDFIEEHCLVGVEHLCGSSELYGTYRKWTEENRTFTWSQKKFIIKLKGKIREKFKERIESDRDGTRTRRILRGIALRGPMDL